MAVSKYNALTILVILVFVPYMIQEPGFLDFRYGYSGLVPLLATGLLYLPFGLGLRKPNKYSETSSTLAALALVLGVAVPALVMVLMLVSQSTVLGLTFNKPFYYIAIVLAYLAMVYQIGAFFSRKR